ncbi:MAG TPA: DUF2251 domain-containing protein [Dyella sp.]|uniref:DUF2251 domain-containing protein n=1 Tax=Dyella sp. TaxID=1869338 RepID=UPI002F922640
MPLHNVVEHPLTVGGEQFIEGPAPGGRYAAIFEDDGDTGYLYALDLSRQEQPIQDALHIYNVVNIADRETMSTLTIGWSGDGLKAALLINGHPHAVIDFVAKHGYCRTGFPPPSIESGWIGHDWDDTAMDLFA